VPEATSPSKAGTGAGAAAGAKELLDALTDSKLAWTRGLRKTLSGITEGRLFIVAADGVAGRLLEQFPGLPAGRVLMAAAQALAAMKQVLAPYGFDDADAVLAVAGLAAERLDREGAGRD